MCVCIIELCVYVYFDILRVKILNIFYILICVGKFIFIILCFFDFIKLNCILLKECVILFN